MVDRHSRIMESTLPDVHALLAARLHRLRTEQGLTLDALAQRAGVRRSMISLLERGVSSAALFAEEARPDASPLARRVDHVTWRDPESGYLRRNLSPPGFSSPIE